jgi:hypothetical protein
MTNRYLEALNLAKTLNTLFKGPKININVGQYYLFMREESDSFAFNYDNAGSPERYSMTKTIFHYH